MILDERAHDSEPLPPRRLSMRVACAAVAALAVVVGAGSLLGGGPVDRLALRLPGVDKVLHTVSFVLLFAATHFVARHWLRLAVGSAAVAGPLVLIAIADELAQAFQPTRDFDVLDLTASLSGIVLGVAWAERRHWAGRAAGLAAAGSLVSIGITTASFLEQRHIAAALGHERAGEFVAARREYRLAFDQGIRTPALFNELAWVEIESGVGDAREAVRFAEQALALTPNDPDVHDTYGWALHHAGRSAQALPYLERAYREKPDMFCIHYHLGEVYLALGQTDKAKGHLRRQVERTETREAARAARTLARLEVDP